MSNDKPPSYDPTPAEIRRVFREIQSGWTPQERESRLRGNVCVTKYDAPNVVQDARGAIAAKLADRRKAMRQA